MAKAKRKGQFVRGGGRVGGGGSVVVVTPARAPAKRKRAAAPARRKSKARRRSVHRGGAGSGITLGKAVLTGLVLGSAAETNNGPLGPTLYNVVQKIPGAKTFGGAATAGLALGAIGHFTSLGGPKVRPWLRIAGLIGIGLAAVKVGTTGTAFKWLGEDEYGGSEDGLMDVET